MIYQKISSLINKIHFLLSQFTAKNNALMKMYQTPKNSAVGDISRCLNRQDFAWHLPFALRSACGTVLQTVAEEFSKAKNTITKAKNTIFKHPEITLNGGQNNA